MIDRAWIGRQLEPRSLAVEAGRLRFFAKAIGETNPLYFDAVAARGAGFPGLPAPPTFLFSPDIMLDFLAHVGVPLERVLHGEQRFDYRRVVTAGETLVIESSVVNIYDKKNGTLEFVEIESIAVGEDGATAATLRSVAVIRH